MKVSRWKYGILNLIVLHNILTINSCQCIMCSAIPQHAWNALFKYLLSFETGSWACGPDYLELSGIGARQCQTGWRGWAGNHHQPSGSWCWKRKGGIQTLFCSPTWTVSLEIGVQRCHHWQTKRFLLQQIPQVSSRAIYMFKCIN